MLELIDPSDKDVEWLPGISLRFVYGHTEAMMLPIIDTPEGTVMYCADLIPSRWHVRMPYIMAYDVRPLDTMKEKERLLNEAADGAFGLYFEHDPSLEQGRVARDDFGNFSLI
jgi:glyoxylase-like metal-dependent hydrolase (beta-lactamase superfamily II)